MNRGVKGVRHWAPELSGRVQGARIRRWRSAGGTLQSDAAGAIAEGMRAALFSGTWIERITATRGGEA